MLSDFYEPNRAFAYYRHVIAWIQSFHPKTVLDVGGRRSPVLESLDPSIERVSLDKERIPGLQAGIRRITCDFMNWTPDKVYDVVACIQVLHHVEDPSAFAQRLFDTGRVVIIVVPYNLPQGMNSGRHAMISERTVYQWTQRTPNATQLIIDVGMQYLMCIYG